MRNWRKMKERWEWKNQCFWSVVLEKTSESALGCKEIKPVYLKRNQAWIFLERPDSETDSPILLPLGGKNWLTWKDPDSEEDWRQEVKGMTEHEIVEWHLQLKGHEFEHAPRTGDGLGGLERCSPWGNQELDMTEHMKRSDPLGFRGLTPMSDYPAWGSGIRLSPRTLVLNVRRGLIIGIPQSWENRKTPPLKSAWNFLHTRCRGKSSDSIGP